MAIALDLVLEERRSDRVRVGVALGPDDEDAVTVDGASVRLVDADGTELCARALLPIAGQLHGQVVLSVELRTSSPIPDAARVVASAWHGAEAWEASCPADPYQRLRDHMLGAGRPGPEAGEVLIEAMAPGARACLARRLPWIDEPLRAPDHAGVIEAAPDAQDEDDFIDDLGLDEDAADWLKDLLHEEDV